MFVRKATTTTAKFGVANTGEISSLAILCAKLHILCLVQLFLAHENQLHSVRTVRFARFERLLLNGCERTKVLAVAQKHHNNARSLARKQPWISGLTLQALKPRSLLLLFVGEAAFAWTTATAKQSGRQKEKSRNIGSNCNSETARYTFDCRSFQLGRSFIHSFSESVSQSVKQGNIDRDRQAKWTGELRRIASKAAWMLAGLLEARRRRCFRQVQFQFHPAFFLLATSRHCDSSIQVNCMIR